MACSSELRSLARRGYQKAETDLGRALNPAEKLERSTARRREPSSSAVRAELRWTRLSWPASVRITRPARPWLGTTSSSRP